MAKLFFTPGPTQLHSLVPEYISTALGENVTSWSHRSSKFDKLFEATTNSVKKLLGAPEKFKVFFVSSGTEAMERIVQNVSGRHTFHFVNGAFSERFYQCGKELGKAARAMEAPFGQGFNFEMVNIPNETELICCTHNETSSGVMIDSEQLSRLKARFPDKFLAVDMVSSAPYVKLDYNSVDCAFFSVQKLFGLPAGLGVLLVNDAAIAKSLQLMAAGSVIGSYHNFPTLLSYAKKFETPMTPNTLAIYLLGKVAEDYLSYGIDKIRSETEIKARYIYNFFDQHPKFKVFVDDRRIRSATVITLDVKGDLSSLKAYLDKLELEVGSGYGPHKDKQIRIANFPMHSLLDVERLCQALYSWNV